MRMMVRVQLDTEKSNEAIAKGRLSEVLESAVQRLKPEASYFLPERGKRACLFVVDMQDSAQLPTIAEPFFTELGGEIEVTPAMDVEEMRRGLEAYMRESGKRV
jgi:hypothetical protein